MTPPLVIAAHGSRDPRSAATVRALVKLLRVTVPAHAGFLDLSAPLIPEVLSGLYRAGHRRIVVLPLLLGKAYHATVDLPILIEQTCAECPDLSVRTTPVLGADPRLLDLAARRLTEAGADLSGPDLGVAFTAVGSSDPVANAEFAELAAGLGARVTATIRPAYATTDPTVSNTLANLRAAGIRRTAIGSWFLAPGLLPDRVTNAAREFGQNVAVAAPLGADPVVAEVVRDRYHTALAPELASTA